MSYINEALKKAQKQRETKYQEYSGVTSRTEKKGRLFPGSLALWIFIIFVFISVAFAIYYWFDFKGPSITTTPGHKLKKAVTRMPPVPITDPEKIYNKARLFHKSGRLRDAKRMYQEALRLHPGYVDALNNLGVIFIHDRDFIAARSSFQKAIRLEPANVDPYYNLACVCAVMGETKMSLAYLKKAVSLNKSAIDWARKDADLQKLRGLSEFKDIIDNNSIRSGVSR
jgi:tetratricopeptide (TPR) repeat protein